MTVAEPEVAGARDDAAGSVAGAERRPSGRTRAGPAGPSRGWRSLAGGGAAYVALSVALWWNVWSTHPSSVTTCGCGDTSLFTWFLAWPAHALAHGMNPLYSTYLFHPGGVNLLSNTAEVGLGILLAPVTWAFGPIATVNVALTLSPALSAFTCYVLLRRWVSWSPAAFFGGLLYGFSPFVVISLTDAHLMLGMGAMLPLLVLCLDELLVRQRWRPWVTGSAIGLVALAQFSVGTEMLVIMLIAAGLGTVLVVAGAALFHRDVLEARAPYALRAAVAAVVSSAVLLAYPAWFALAGPAHLSGDVWGPSADLAYGGNNLRAFWHPSAPSAAATALTHRFGGYQAPTLSSQYLGLGLLTVLSVGLLVWRRDLKLWLFAAVGVVCAFFSVGLAFHGWSLWRLVAWLPMMGNIIPSRFSLVVYLCAGVMLGLVADHAYRAAAGRPGRRGALPGAGRLAGLAVVAVALVPIVSYFADGLPLTTVAVQLPEWFRTEAPNLPPNQVLLVFPFAFRQSNMTWQAVGGMHYALVGGGGPGSLFTRAGREEEGQRYVSSASFSQASQSVTPEEIAAVRNAFDGWGVTTVVLPDPAYLPEYARVFAVRSIVVLVTAVTGQAPEYRDRAWVWRGVDHAPSPVRAGAAQLDACTAGPMGGSVASLQAAAACVLARPPAP